MYDNDNILNEEIKIYLKLKAVKNESTDPYIKVSPNKNMITFIGKPSSHDSRTTKTDYEIDKIFMEKDEYSYLYEELTSKCVFDALNGLPFCFISSGDTNGEKHSIIFGGKNCHNDLTERGIFPRLVEYFNLKPNITLSYSIMCVYDNKLIDLSKFANEAISSVLQKDLLNNSIEIKPTIPGVNMMTKIPVRDANEFLAQLKAYNLLFAHLYDIEPKSEYKLYSFSNFVYVLYINDQSGNNISTITLCELAGNEAQNTQVTNPKHAPKNSIINTKAVINNANTIESLKISIKNLKHSRLKSSSEKAKFQVENCKLVIVLQNLCFRNPSTNFIIIGSIVPNIGMQETALNTLRFIFQCKQIVYEREGSDLAFTDIEEANKINLINKLQMKIKDQEINIKDLVQLVECRVQQCESSQTLYKKQVDKLKSSLGFNGDVNILLGGNEFSKEAVKARTINESIANLACEKHTNEKLLKEISHLKDKILFLTNENEILKNDKLMINYLKQVKVNKSHETKKISSSLDNSTQINKLKEDNQKLALLVEEYKKDIDNKCNIIQGFSKMVESKKDQIKTKEDIRLVVEKEMINKNKEDQRLLQKRYDKEIEIVTKKYEGAIQLRDEKMKILLNSNDELILNRDKAIERYTKEMVQLYEIIVILIKTYKKEFDWHHSMNVSLNDYNKFINSKVIFSKVIDNTETVVNNTNFPITLKAFDLRKGEELTKAMLDDVKSALSDKFNHNSKEVSGFKRDNDSESNYQLLIKENKNLREKVKELIESNRIKDDKCSCGNLQRLSLANIKLAKKIEDIAQENTKNKIVINAHERVVKKLNVENLTIRKALACKITTNNLNYPRSISTLKSRNYSSKPLTKAQSTSNMLNLNNTNRLKIGNYQHQENVI